MYSINVIHNKAGAVSHPSAGLRDHLHKEHSYVTSAIYRNWQNPSNGCPILTRIATTRISPKSPQMGTNGLNPITGPVMSWSLPDTCISCVHYQQTGFRTDEHARTKDQYGFDCEPKSQRYGFCKALKCSVFWNERTCTNYEVEQGIITHPCETRPCALEPHQDPLI